MFFLEVNPNGQWAWLDIDDEVGLITAMVEAFVGMVRYRALRRPINASVGRRGSSTRSPTAS